MDLNPRAINIPDKETMLLPTALISSHPNPLNYPVPAFIFNQVKLGQSPPRSTMSLLLRRLTAPPPHLPPPLPLPLTPPFPFPSSIRLPLRRLHFSATATRPPSTNPQLAADYLIQSWGLPPDKAIQASTQIQHLKSFEKPDAVLQFLRQTGISESDIRTAVARDPRILCSSVENSWRPNVAQMQEEGFSMEDISCIISRCPGVFLFNVVRKIDFWLPAVGSVENLSAVLKRNGQLLHSSLERVALPNLSFLKEQCGLSVRQIARLIKSAPRVIIYNPEFLKNKAQRADELGVSRSSPMFVYALLIVCKLSQRTIDARLNNLKSLGLSQEEIATLVRKHPFVLAQSEEVMGRKIEFLRKEVGCDTLDLVANPGLLTYSLEKRLIPRNLVRKLLKSKGLPAADLKFVCFAKLTDKVFVEKFVLPYEHAIPGLHRAYADA